MNFDVILSSIAGAVVIIAAPLYWLFKRKRIERLDRSNKKMRILELKDEKERLLFKLLEIDEELSSLENEGYNT